MKIGFFVHGYLPWDPYGVPRYVERTANYLIDNGHQVYLIVVGRPNLPKTEKPKSNFSIKRTRYVNFPIKKLTPYWSLASYTVCSLIEASRLVKKEQIQILHGHTIQWGGLQSALVSRITHKPCVITLHGSALASYTQTRLPTLYSFLRWANVLICQKKSAARKLTSWGFSEQNIELMSQGCVDTERFRPADTKSPRSTFVITFLGRLLPFKGPDLLLDAAPHVLKEKPNTVFQFIGEGELKGRLNDKANSLHISDNVRFLGLRNDVDDLLRGSDVFVSLSPYENVSDLSLLEAMATGVPVVATDSGETSHTVKDGKTGLLAKCNPKDIANKILILLNDKHLSEKLSMNERNFVVAERCLDISAKREEEIYWSILNGRK